MRGVKEGRYIKPTPVQMQAIPVIMESRDAIVLAETGSGKSLAFFAPLLEKIQRGTGLKCLVIAPTRELTIQLYKEFLMFLEQSGRLKSGARVKFMRKALFPNHEGELTKLIRDVEILIGTPLKFAQLTEKFPQEISSLKYIVLDEADKMFEMGFQEQIDTILSNVADSAQTCKLMFSATMQPNIQELVKRVMVDPVRI